MNRAKFCPACTTPLQEEEVAGRLRPKCLDCGLVLFKNPASAAAGVVLDRRSRVLLIRRAIEPYKGYWALPAGYQEIDETPQETVSREVKEETGIIVEPVRLIDLIFIPDDSRKPANLSIHLCIPVGGELCPADDAEDAAWFAMTDLPEDMGFHNRERILQPLLEQLGREAGESSLD